jgi:hypothetical protein
MTIVHPTPEHGGREQLISSGKYFANGLSVRTVSRRDPNGPSGDSSAGMSAKSRQPTVTAMPCDRFPATVAKISIHMILNEF